MSTRMFEMVTNEILSAIHETIRITGFMALRRFRIVKKREEGKKREKREKRARNLLFLYCNFIRQKTICTVLSKSLPDL